MADTEYLIKGSTLTAIADVIRDLDNYGLGFTTMAPTDMPNNINALVGAAAGTASGGASLTTKTVVVSVYRGSTAWCTYTTLDSNGNMIGAYMALGATDVSIPNCVVGTTFTLSYNAMELTDVSNTTEVYAEDQSFYVGTVV